jgi:hypothetical protein
MDQLDHFLGPQIYIWSELLCIFGILFSREDRAMIRKAAMTAWEREHPPGPKNQNLAKAFDVQGKDEEPADFLHRLENHMRK